METRWRIELLGGVRVTQAERAITPFRRRQVEAFFVYLAFYGGRAHPREELIELLWPEIDPEVGRNNLRVVLHRLREQLAEPDSGTDRLLLTDRDTVRLNPTALTTDVAEFGAALAGAAEAADPADRARLLTAAVALYRGELLPGAFGPWVLTERQHLAEAYLGAMHRLVDALEQAGDLEQALQVARRAVAADPLREEGHYDLMRLYAAAGQPTATVRQYQELERLLREELGETPSAATRALAEELHQSARTLIVARRTPSLPAGPPPSAPPASRVAPPPAADTAGQRASRPTDDHPVTPAQPLPVQLTRFFGREEEIARLEELLCSPVIRLVTLTGPGGSGKTRLAIAVAGRLEQAFEGRVGFVALADLPEASLVPAAVADALGLARATGIEPLEQVIEALRSGPWLLVLDNFEHLVLPGELSESAALVRSLLERLPTLTCLVTSRQPLGIAGEQEFALLPLPTPRRSESLARLERYASVQLFLDRARAVRADFRLTDGNATAIATLCERLEGLPLALELAAARTRALTPEQMLERLVGTGTVPAQRFELLVSGRRDVSNRHRSLRAAIQWSYQLLAPELQRFFARLSVFRGSWTLEAAEQVCQAPEALPFLEQLQQSSLVYAEEAGHPLGAAMRYRLLESLREFAAEQLSPEEWTALTRRHTEFFLALAEEAESKVLGVDPREWLECLECEHDNLRAALAWCVGSGEEEVGLRLAAALAAFWGMRGYVTEGRRWLEAVLAQGSGTPTRARAKALTRAGRLADAMGDAVRAQALLEAAVGIYQAWGSDPHFPFALICLGYVALHQHDYARAGSRFSEALAVATEQGDGMRRTDALAGLGHAAVGLGDYAAARSHYEAALAERSRCGNRRGIALALRDLGDLARLQGEHQRAAAHFGECLGLFRDVGDKEGIADTLEGLASLAAAAGEFQRAACLWGAMEALHAALGLPVRTEDHTELGRLLKVTRAALDEAAFAAAWSEGQAMTTEEAVAAALGQAGPRC